MLERVRKILHRKKHVDIERQIETIHTEDGYVVLKVLTHHYTCNCPDFNGLRCQHTDEFMTDRLSRRIW